MKRSGPSFRQQRVALKTCGECHGRGLVKPMFYEVPCTGCNGGGVLDKKTGQALALEDLVVQLRLIANERGQEVRELQQKLADQNQPERGHGPMGRPYHGD